ncbi:hypothetical protein OK016_12295 [Vibrio chagasii]|nr:hypothetical protein [Vibrio chagasii]
MLKRYYYLLCVSGVYVVEKTLDIDGVPVGGVANIGQRPTK